MKKILVTGGIGFIGSHTVVELIQNNYQVVIADNLSNSKKIILDNLEKICETKIPFYQIDLCNKRLLTEMFEKEKYFDAVIHFAALKSVYESIQQPIYYYQNNLISLLNLLEVMELYSTSSLVFSSSCTVYGIPDKLPVTEDTPFGKPLCAYASTKQMAEDILEKISWNKKIKVVALRYFNPVGAHSSGLIGELPLGKPNNLMPCITQFAIGKLSNLYVWGNDYETPDGSCIRDYIHVVDLAQAHLLVCKNMLENKEYKNFEFYNVGTGKGISVLEMIKIFESENKIKLNYHIKERRQGDVACIYADKTKIESSLNWKTQKTISDMVKDAWMWEKNLLHFIK